VGQGIARHGKEHGQKGGGRRGGPLTAAGELPFGTENEVGGAVEDDHQKAQNPGGEGKGGKEIQNREGKGGVELRVEAEGGPFEEVAEATPKTTGGMAPPTKSPQSQKVRQVEFSSLLR
jgi:hypothetical protein